MGNQFYVHRREIHSQTNVIATLMQHLGTEVMHRWPGMHFQMIFSWSCQALKDPQHYLGHFSLMVVWSNCSQMPITVTGGPLGILVVRGPWPLLQKKPPPLLIPPHEQPTQPLICATHYGTAEKILKKQQFQLADNGITVHYQLLCPQCKSYMAIVKHGKVMYY